jgi:hydrogenase expression/formation protein HypE
VNKKQTAITLEHGNGGRSSHELVREVFLPAFDNSCLGALLDSALVKNEDHQLAFTTDSYIVRPVFFPGGDIGKLAVAGTANDLAVCGAEPRYLSAGFILEEGFPLADLRRIVDSMKKTAENAGMSVVTGDTKVVPRGQADGIYINTSGIGFIVPGMKMSPSSIRPGDKVIVSGPLGDHAAAVMKARGDFPIAFAIASDCAPQWPLIRTIYDNIPAEALKVMRDPTRGGLATTLVELTHASRFSIELDEQAIPVRDEVRALCELTGFDPLYLACEGRVIVVCRKEYAENLLEIMIHHELGVGAAVIGTVTEDHLCRVSLHTQAGGTRIVDMLVSDMLPRIC